MKIEFKGKRILDFGSGEGITANHFAEGNEVITVQPNREMLEQAWKDNSYVQIFGDICALSRFDHGFFDVIICHNVVEYINDKKQIINERGECWLRMVFFLLQNIIGLLV